MLALYFLIPTLSWIVFAKLWLKHEFSIKEMAVQTGVSVAVITGLFVASDLVQTGSTKLVNGEVTATRPVKKFCPVGWVSYTDGHCTNYTTRTEKVGEVCTTDPQGNRNCVPIYQTQYFYFYPWERRYFVDSDLPKTFEIARVDNQGQRTPPRFASIQIGDPVTAEVFYKNYIRAAKDSLFRGEKLDALKVAYPRVFDYYRAKRVIYDGVSVSEGEADEWSDSLAALNRDLRKSGANVIIVITSQSEAYADRLAYTWGGHNINDLVITLGVNETADELSWVDVRSWSGNSLVNITIRDALMASGKVDPAAFNEIILKSVNESYRLRDMSEFQYLKNDIPLPTITLVMALLFVLILSPLITYVFARRTNWR